MTGTPLDTELGKVRDGYPALAAWIAQDPDGETLVFRRFGMLGVRNILHLQAQLIALEKEIGDLDEEARRSNDFEARQASRRWETMAKHANDPDRNEGKRIKKMEELREMLKKYCQ